MTNLLQDVRLTKQGVQVKQTGHHIPMEIGTVVDILKWVRYDHNLRKTPKLCVSCLKVCFHPHKAARWYFARAIVERMGAEIVENPAEADLVWSFEDSTHTEEVQVPGNAVTFNAECTDISKTHVGDVFREAFGYDMSADPATYDGDMVEKSEVNGAHDGRIVHGPIEPNPDAVYQRLVDNRTDDGHVEDLRTTIIGGRPVLVFRKKRPESSRFANSNADVTLSELDEVFTQDEINKITAFAKGLKLDAGGVDVLRDRKTGKLFIVDANKTDMGPPLALSLEDKLRATTLMAEAVEDVMDEAIGWRVDAASRMPAHSRPNVRPKLAPMAV
ncbi:MAG: hypothetical protein AAF317_08210 [Pseudomonadota bacterium]